MPPRRSLSFVADQPASLAYGGNVCCDLGQCHALQPAISATVFDGLGMGHTRNNSSPLETSLAGYHSSVNLFSSIKMGSARLWLVASSFSLLLLALVVSQLDIPRFVAMLARIRIEFLLLAMGLLLGEGVMTAQRIRLFCSGQPKMTDALLANAWYSVLNVLLPARLGEFAAVVVLEKLLAQKRGAAVMSIISQRLFDIVVLGSLFMAALFIAIQILPPLLSALVSLGVVSCALLCVLYQEQVLSVLASFLMHKGVPERRTRRRSLLRIVLQARVWRRHSCKAGLNRKA